MNNYRSTLDTQMPLRLWPAVVIVVVQCLLRFGLPAFVPPGTELFSVPVDLVGVLGGTAGGLAIALWWLFFSRARWSERLIAIAVVAAVAFAMRPFTHMSIQNGMMGMMFGIYLIPPTLALAFVAWAAVSRRLYEGPRYAALVVAALIGCGVWTLARTNGIQGGVADLEWRWTPTAEEQLLARAGDEPVEIAQSGPVESPAPAAAPIGADAKPALLAPTPPAAETPEKQPIASGENSPIAMPETGAHLPAAEWPGFRGAGRNGVVHGVRIATDWSASPPVEMWRRPIGPGWSSFSVRGDLLYTQEQRGDEEIVACYRVSTGAPVWKHRDAVRFWESNGGAGPRGTPTIHNDHVYAFGATGILNALDATNGKLVWSHNVATDTNRTVPDWGFASSPLVVGDIVVVAASGTLAAYDIASGTPRWVGPQHGGTYSSPQLVTIDGVEQILLLSAPGAVSVSPADGTLLWEYTWEGGAIVQPALTADGGILINAQSMSGGAATRRLAVTHGPGGWNAEERWTSNGLKPYFNDFVVHNGHAFGFDGNILACIDLADGKRKWKGGRFGNGQLMLLAEQDLLLVLSEEGELALVSATTDQFKELARFPVLSAKTWNHPALVGDVLLVRNGEEMAAFRLSLAGAGKKETLFGR